MKRVWRDPDNILNATPPPFYDSIEAYWEMSQENHELNIRLDERTNNIWRSVTQMHHDMRSFEMKVDKHFEQLNHTVGEHSVKIAIGTSSRKRLWWVIGIIIVAILGLSGLAVDLIGII